MTETHMD